MKVFGKLYAQQLAQVGPGYTLNMPEETPLSLEDTIGILNCKGRLDPNCYYINHVSMGGLWLFQATPLGAVGVSQAGGLQWSSTLQDIIDNIPSALARMDIESAVKKAFVCGLSIRRIIDILRTEDTVSMDEIVKVILQISHAAKLRTTQPYKNCVLTDELNTILN